MPHDAIRGQVRNPGLPAILLTPCPAPQSIQRCAPNRIGSGFKHSGLSPNATTNAVQPA